MLDLVGNPEDQFSHDAAHIYQDIGIAAVIGTFRNIIFKLKRLIKVLF